MTERKILFPPLTYSPDKLVTYKALNHLQNIEFILVIEVNFIDAGGTEFCQTQIWYSLSCQ